MKLEDLTPEQMEKAKAMKTPEELLEFAKSEGYELSDDELSAVSGGRWSGCEAFRCESDTCPALDCTSVVCSSQTCPFRK